MKNRERVTQVLDGLVARFEAGDMPALVAIAAFPGGENKPINKWSILNQVLCYAHGTADARGFRQWQQAGRQVKKGSKALYILVPMTFKAKDKDGQDDDEKKPRIWFKAQAVFAVEDTDGAALDYMAIEAPDWPLRDVATAWGIDVSLVPGNGTWRGMYRADRAQIIMATPHEKTFFHELSHAAHRRIDGKLKPGQDPLQEVIAELCAQALCHMVGKGQDDTARNSFEYIQAYAAERKLSAGQACMRVLKKSGQVLELILETAKMPQERQVA